MPESCRVILYKSTAGRHGHEKNSSRPKGDRFFFNAGAFKKVQFGSSFFPLQATAKMPVYEIFINPAFGLQTAYFLHLY